MTLLYGGLAIAALAAFLAFAYRRWTYKGLASILDAPEPRYSRRRENSRRYRQICNGVLNRENGLGVLVAPAVPPLRPLGSPRASLRRLMRTMKARGHVPG
jgi:hypothetical protein